MLLPLFALSACAEDHFHATVRDSDMRIANQVKPADVGQILGHQGPNESPDDPMAADNPMAGGGGGGSSWDSFGGSIAGGSDPVQASDPLASSSADSAPQHDRPIKNWYWLRGNIGGGSMDVKVNGIFVLQASVHVDTEISDYLNPGENQITFVPNPTNPDEPVTCHLDVVYSQQESGSLPALTYDTSNPSMQGSDQLTTADQNVSQPNQSGQGTVTVPASPGVGAPVLSPTPIAATPVPVTLEFNAK